MDDCDNANGPCACGAWHKPGDGTFGQPGAKAPVLPTKWDIRFMRLAIEVSTWSKDPSTHVGAVVVSPDRSDIILGYNGFARKMNDDPALYADRPVKYGRIIHGEMNAVLMARRSVEGYTLYTWPMLSCSRCAVHMIQSGIARVVGPLPPADQQSRWAEELDKTRGFFAEAGVVVLEAPASAFAQEQSE